MFESDKIIEFGTHLKNLRLSLGFTQKDVQRLSGLNINSLRKIENGDVLPRYDTIFYLSLVGSMSIYWTKF